MKTGIGVWGSLVLAALAFACGSEQQERSATRDELRATVDSLKGTGYFPRLELRAGQQRALKGFYRDRNYEPAWNQSDSLLPVVDSRLVALDSAGSEGLDPEAYRVTERRRLRETARRDTSVNREKSLAQLDLLAGNNGWNTDKMNPYTRLKNLKRVDLQRKLPIAVAYQSAWVDQAGRLNLRRDVYGLDRKQLAAIGQQKQMLSGNNPHSHESNLSRRPR